MTTPTNDAQCPDCRQRGERILGRAYYLCGSCDITFVITTDGAAEVVDALTASEFEAPPMLRPPRTLRRGRRRPTRAWPPVSRPLPMPAPPPAAAPHQRQAPPPQRHPAGVDSARGPDVPRDGEAEAVSPARATDAIAHLIIAGLLAALIGVFLVIGILR